MAMDTGKLSVPNKFSLSKEPHFPSFFKIYLPEHNSTRLRIPPDFIGNFNRVIPKKAFLKNLLGKFWYVELEEVDGSLFITKGWDDYLSDHSLTRGDFLIFTYSGSSVFSVKVFGSNGCIKGEPVGKGKDIGQVKDEVEQITTEHVSTRQRGDTRSETPSEINEGSEQAKEVTPAMIVVGNKKVWGRNSFHCTYEEIRRVEAYRCRNPSFVVKMMPSYVKHMYRPCLPPAFTSRYLTQACGTVILHSLSGKTWPVTCKLEKQYMRLRRGWKDFVLDNSIKVGDICIFELIKSTKQSLKVHIIPSTGLLDGSQKLPKLEI